MIRPIDIQEKEFSRAVRGYKEDEVNAFLDEITLDLERLLNELRETKEENSRLVEELERHRGSEGTVVVSITVDSNGKVVRANVKSATTTSTALRNSALAAAKQSTFSAGSNNAESGTITYIFKQR